MYKRNNKGIATWAKWLIGLIIAGTILFISTIGIVAYVAWSQFGNMMDSEKAESVAQTVVTMDKLPERYQYSMGMDFFGLFKMFAVQDKEAEILISFVRMPNKDKNMTADELVEQLAKEGIPTADTAKASSIDVTDKGILDLKAGKLPYVIGTTRKDATSEPIPAFLGCLVPKPSEVLLICAVESSTQKQEESTDLDEENKKTTEETEEQTSDEKKTELSGLNLETMKNFLDLVKEFK